MGHSISDRDAHVPAPQSLYLYPWRSGYRVHRNSGIDFESYPLWALPNTLRLRCAVGEMSVRNDVKSLANGTSTFWITYPIDSTSIECSLGTSRSAQYGLEGWILEGGILVLRSRMLTRTRVVTPEKLHGTRDPTIVENNALRCGCLHVRAFEQQINVIVCGHDFVTARLVRRYEWLKRMLFVFDGKETKSPASPCWFYVSTTLVHGTQYTLRRVKTVLRIAVKP